MERNGEERNGLELRERWGNGAEWRGEDNGSVENRGFDYKSCRITVLYCIVLYCVVLYCDALCCAVL